MMIQTPLLLQELQNIFSSFLHFVIISLRPADRAMFFA